MATAMTQRSMELEGNLRTFQLPDILRFLAMGRLTGRLGLENGPRVVELQIRNGALVGTATRERFIRLGQLLVYSGLITRKDLDDALEQQAHGTGPGSGLMIGEMLIERRLVTSEQVEQALRLQIKEELWELFSWTDGTFKFEHGATDPIARALLELPIEPLISEGLDRTQQWAGITRQLGDANQIFRVRSDIPQPFEQRLAPGVWRVLALINGRNSVRTLIYVSGLGRFDTLHALDTLLGMQVIEPVEHRPRAMRAGAAASAPMQLVRKEDTRPDAEDEESAGGLLGLFGKKRRNGTHRDPAETNGCVVVPQAQVGPFFSAVGLGCALINRMAEKFSDEAAGDATLGLELIWSEAAARHPRADLLELRGGRLDGAQLDRFIKIAGGIDKPLLGSFDESLDALAEAGHLLLQRGLVVLGARAEALAEDAIRPYVEGVLVQHPGEFNARAWTRGWMKADA